MIDLFLNKRKQKLKEQEIKNLEERKKKVGIYRVVGVECYENISNYRVNFYYFDQNGEIVNDKIYFKEELLKLNKDEFEKEIKTSIENVIKNGKSTKLTLINNMNGRVEF